MFGIDDVTIYLWENNRVAPSLAKIPKILDFLGRDPFETKTETLGDRIRKYRRVHGLSQKKLSRLVGVNPSTVGAWEKDENRPLKRNLEKFTSILDS